VSRKMGKSAIQEFELRKIPKLGLDLSNWLE
jgi:hypothetical protein